MAYQPEPSALQPSNIRWPEREKHKVVFFTELPLRESTISRLTRHTQLKIGTFDPKEIRRVGRNIGAEFQSGSQTTTDFRSTIFVLYAIIHYITPLLPNVFFLAPLDHYTNK